MRGWRAALLAPALALASPAAAEAPLRVIAVDVEGGAATLFVTPGGRSLLIDTGWPAGMGKPRPAAGAPPSPSSAQRIAAAAKAAGVQRIDYLLITHYHIDHIGGIAELLSLMPVGTVIDHGPNREALPADAKPMQVSFSPATLYPKYLAAIAGYPHREMKAGETLRIDGLLLTAVTSDRTVIARPLPGSGGPGRSCGAAATMGDNGGEENPRSLGVLAAWGQARILALGDTTIDVEEQLVCPRDRIGPVDLMIADNHGSSNSNGPALLDTIGPRIVVTDNGATKGADAKTFANVMASPRLKALWQLHYATRNGDAANPPPARIANLADGPDAMHPLRIAISRDATIAVENPRTGVTETYRR